jgi:hypothetical protein
MLVQVCEELSVLLEALLEPGAILVLEHLQVVSGGWVELAHADDGTGRDDRPAPDLP